MGPRKNPASERWLLDGEEHQPFERLEQICTYAPDTRTQMTLYAVKTPLFDPFRTP
jgi:hypothetical protein